MIAGAITAAPTSPSPRRSARRSLLEACAAAVLFSIALSACNGPCEQLANVICDCELSTAAKNQCLEQVRAAMQNREVSKEEDLLCSAALDTCDCDKLESDKTEDLKMCGLSK
jgi:hypothetical protein